MNKKDITNIAESRIKSEKRKITISLDEYAYSRLLEISKKECCYSLEGCILGILGAKINDYREQKIKTEEDDKEHVIYIYSQPTSRGGKLAYPDQDEIDIIREGGVSDIEVYQSGTKAELIAYINSELDKGYANPNEYFHYKSAINASNYIKEVV